MQNVTLDVKPRAVSGEEKKLTLTQLRQSGWIPAVLYGHGKPAQIAVEKKTFHKAIHTEAGVNALFNVTLEGKAALSIIKEVQRDIFTQEPIHVDFQRINVKEKITVNVPIHIKGEPTGVKNSGGILELMQREIQIRCLPDQIPGHVDVDVTNLDLHQSIKVQDLKFAEGIDVLTALDHLVANVVPPKIEEEKPVVAAVTTEGALPAQPEVIPKGKKDELGAEGAAPADAKKGGAAAPAAAEGKSKK